MAHHDGVAEHPTSAQVADKIVIVGAGMSGIGMAIQLKRLLNHRNFELFEKSDEVGGTWSQSVYPNLSCDVPSEYYSYSFFQKSDWSEKFASQPEILDYMHDCVRHFQLERHIRLQQECTSICWSEEDALWTLFFNDISRHKSYSIQACYVVTAMGVLNIPNGLGNLPALSHFSGQCFHTSQWRDIDFSGMKITNREHFTLIQCDGIEAIEGDDQRVLVDKAGSRHEVDVIIFANGFKTQDLLTPMKVLGIKGKDLRETWKAKGGSEAYMGVSVNGRPNFSMLAGPNTLPSGSSTLRGIECSIIYITQILRSLWARAGVKKAQPLVVMPTQKAKAEFNAMIQQKMKGLVYTSSVNTWYINKNGGKNTLIWPDTQFSFWRSRCLWPIRWSDWTVQSNLDE
ncbi:hypothetical protein F5Y06DRAFT_305100 [Hypoxylon sp. FL0890]|nr:hypothetical protein F5Y06DRAFT_305100 [Hypoxylon sp. FL0890]